MFSPRWRSSRWRRCPPPRQTLDEHLILSYSFEEGQVADGIVDDLSPSGLDGSVVNAGQAPLVPGRADGSSALDLTGGAASSTTAPYVEIPHGLFEGRTEMSIATWLRWDGGADFQWVYNLGKDNASATFLTPSFQGPGTNRSSIKPVNGGAEVGVDGTGKLPAGQWVQAVTAIDGEEIVYYLNGVEVGRTQGAARPGRGHARPERHDLRFPRQGVLVRAPVLRRRDRRVPGLRPRPRRRAGRRALRR